MTNAVGTDRSPSFWSQPLPALLAALGSGARGLAAQDARARLATAGPNLLNPRRERALLVQFLLHFRNPLVLILLAASAIAAALGDAQSVIVIVAIVVMSVILDFTQEYRAGRAADALRSTVALRASVLRDGATGDVPASELVPGDVVQLAAGDLVPADCRVMEARDFFVNQAFLTGESFPVEKHAGDAVPECGMQDAVNAVFMGTSVISGSATVLVARTGGSTALGQIGGALDANEPPTSFERGIGRFGMLIMRLTVLLVLFVLLVNALFHRPLLESFLFAVALAVGLTPELLPMVVSVTLSRGAMRMAKQHVIVKRLSSVQDLGAMDVLCTDKTGTLTEGRIRMERALDAEGHDSARAFELAYMNSHFETGLRSPLDHAILGHADVDVSTLRKIDEVPFDFERRRVSVLLEHNADRLLVVKGAPEDILEFCTRYESGSAKEPLPLDARARDAVRGLIREQGEQGLRALGVAWRAVPPDHPHAVVSDESELVFAGILVFLDPPKIGAAAALAALAAHGVRVKILTGDDELVTRHVCAQLGFPLADVLHGHDMQHLDIPALHARVEQADAFCRVTPAQKARILEALKARGHVVGFLGDGINDAPSLRIADAGISVDGAVDVAKEAADMIMLEHDLDVLVDGVREGRRTFANVMKYILMGTSSNFGNMFSMAGATVLLPFLPMLPVQILLNNLLYDISELVLPFDRVDESVLSRPCTWDISFVRRYMLTLGPVSSFFDFLTFYVLYRVFDAGAALFHTGWFVESVATQVMVVFVIRTRGSVFASRPNAWLVGMALSIVAIALVLPALPFVAPIGLVPLPASLYAVIAAIVLCYLVAMEGMKGIFFRRWAGADAMRQAPNRI